MAPRIEPSDLQRLTALLALTASDHDGEALTAVRKANALLARLKLHWVEIFAAAGTVRDLTMREKIDAAFDYVLATTKPGSFRDCILDIQYHWAMDHALSPKQIKVLFDAEERQRVWAEGRADG